MEIRFKSIGTISTPYKTIAPFRPDNSSEEKFCIKVFEDYADALTDLEKFSHIIVYFYFDKSDKTNLIAHPPHMGGESTGLFASRSPNRINKIGMDIVQLIEIKGNIIYTSPMDILDGTPLLDIKPYIPDLDCHPGAKKSP